MSRLPTFAFVAAAFLVAAPCRPAESPDRVEGSQGSRVVSPAVVATWIARGQPDGTSRLELLVFWRGTPGWFLRGDSSGSSGSASGGSADDRGAVVERLSFGGIRLDLEYDRSKRGVRIQGHDLALEGANVVLVDTVDGEDGPRVSGTREVDPLLPGGPAEVEAIVRRSPELYAFLRAIPHCRTRRRSR
jgi:hypothetical protein